MTNSLLVSSFNGTADSTSYINQPRETIPTESAISDFSIEKQEIENTRMYYFRSRYQNKGFLQKSIDLFSSTIDKNSSAKISSAIRIWFDWCFVKHVDPTSYSLNHICEFFTNQVTEGKSFNTIAEYRSAISEIHDQVDGISIG